MNFNKVDFSNKEQLMASIQQSGNEGIMGILEDKNIDGQELVEILELVMSWRLTSTEKKQLVTFINNLKLNLSKPMEKNISSNVSKCNTEVTTEIPIKSMNSELTQNTTKTSNPMHGSQPAINIAGKNANFLQELNYVLNHKSCSTSQPMPPIKLPVEDIPVTREVPLSTPEGVAKSVGDLVLGMCEIVCTPIRHKFVKSIKDHEDQMTNNGPDAPGKCLSGNENIAEILKDKNLDGQELLDLTELKIINWRLGSSQKKELFTFINNLEVNPSNMLGKHIPTNVSKSDTDTTKSIPIESKNHELIPNPHSSPSKFPFGNPPEIGISGKKANFVQELNSLLSGALSNPSNLSTSIPKVDNNPVASSNQILNIPRSTRDDETIISKYDQGTSSLSPILYPETSQFRQKDSMNALLPIAQPLQSGSKTPKPYRKPVFSRLGVAKSTGDLVNGWDQVGGPPPVPSKTKVVRKISDHGDKSSKGAGDIRDYSKKETGHFSPPIYNGIADAESSPGKNILKLPQNVLNVPQEVTRKPIPLPTRGIAQPLIQSMDQTVCAPISSSNQRLTKQPIEKKNSIEANSTGKHLKKKTRKFSLPILNPPKASFEPSLLQSPENVSSVSTEVNRKPIPLPTRGFAQPLPQDQAVCAPSPPSKKKIIKHAYDNKNIIEQDATGTNLESDEFRKKEEPPSSKFVDTNDEEESTTKYSIFYVPLEEKTSQETTFGVPYSIDDHGYLQLLQNPVDKTPVSTEKRNEFLLDLSKAVKEKVVQKTVKEKVVQKKVPQWIVQDHSHLSLIITPPSSDDELFDEDQEEEEYTHRSITINQSTTCNKFGLQLLLRPPTRMVTPEFVDEDGYFEINIQHGAKRFNIGNLSNDRYYMQIRGKETKRMLMSREDGSFLFRPSKKFFLVLTIKHGGKLYNFGIDLEADGKIYLDGKSGFALGGFSSLQEFVNYFCCEPITFKDENMMIEIYMNPFLGPDSFSCYNNQKTDHNTYQNIFFSTYTKK